MPNTEQPFRLNWAPFDVNERRSDAGCDLSIFIGDFAADVTDTVLDETFSSKFQSVKGAKVVIDSNTGRSKGYGFVRFGDENERSKAMTEMNGVYCSSRPMRISVATPKKAFGYQQQYYSQGRQASNGAVEQGLHSHNDSNNATIFVGGLDSDVSDDDLRQPFSQFGEIISVKIPLGKGCGFVLFANRQVGCPTFLGSKYWKQTVHQSLLKTDFDSGELILETSGMEVIIDGKATVVTATVTVMAMQHHQVRILACTPLQLPFLVLLKSGEVWKF
ncbi:Polyadenylate-binding RBP47 [Gossypium arboreum]|uniref:Polyadenylate-binding RBP47 n=1 Tax=Gossypium arboreum TaxID=29729 RepID=A0A0B0NXH7_GOSAR|nr:Polyadenylate-binding RBP47 [Gossypium arboreum]